MFHRTNIWEIFLKAGYQVKLGLNMNKKTSELIQTITFVVIVLGQLFLASRYYTRDDMVGTAVFLIVAVLAGIAAFGHFIAWRKAKK
jgi:hypothetical protein